MTKEERHLWYDFLKQLLITFHRQKVIGKYMVDFYCAEHKLVIKLDGNHHYEHDGFEADKKQDSELKKPGITVVKYTNIEIQNNFEGVRTDILIRIGLL